MSGVGDWPEWLKDVDFPMSGKLAWLKTPEGVMCLEHEPKSTEKSDGSGSSSGGTHPGAAEPGSKGESE